ncbi:MAG: hypothetical protein WCW56_00190 [Candidatus Paceibacterota bacterium]|jgi:hypothetical protein
MIKSNRLLTVVIWLTFLCVGMPVAFAATPTGTPPDCPLSNIGCYPPINVGSLTQTKAGGFGLSAGSLKLNQTKYIDFNVIGTASGLIGSKAISSSDALDIIGVGTNKVVIFLENLKTDNFAMSGGSPAVGKVMTSIDARGNAEWRKLFSQACPSGQALTGIAADGSLVCATKYTPGQYYGDTKENINYHCSGVSVGGSCSGIDAASCTRVSGCSWVSLTSCYTYVPFPVYPGGCNRSTPPSNSTCASGFTLHKYTDTCVVGANNCWKQYNCRKN